MEPTDDLLKGQRHLFKSYRATELSGVFQKTKMAFNLLVSSIRFISNQLVLFMIVRMTQTIHVYLYINLSISSSTYLQGVSHIPGRSLNIQGVH